MVHNTGYYKQSEIYMTINAGSLAITKPCFDTDVTWVCPYLALAYICKKKIQMSANSASVKVLSQSVLRGFKKKKEKPHTFHEF